MNRKFNSKKSIIFLLQGIHRGTLKEFLINNFKEVKDKFVSFMKKVFNRYMKMIVRLIKNIIKNISKLNPLSSSKSLYKFYPTYLIRLRMVLINILYNNSPFRKRLYIKYPKWKRYFDELDKKGVLKIHNFLTLEAYGGLINSLAEQVDKAKPYNSSDQSIYKIINKPMFSKTKSNDIKNKLYFIRILMSYVEGSWVSQKRFGPILQSSKETNYQGGENCEPHVDCFYPSAKAFIYLTDVDEFSNPFTYILGSHLRDKNRTSIEVLGHKSRGNIQGSWRSKDININIGDPFQCLGRQGTLIIANVSGFHYRFPSKTINKFRSIIYFAGISKRGNPFLKLALGYITKDI